MVEGSAPIAHQRWTRFSGCVMGNETCPHRRSASAVRGGATSGICPASSVIHRGPDESSYPSEQGF